MYCVQVFPANLLVYPVIKLDLQMHGVVFCMRFYGSLVIIVPGLCFWKT